MRKIDLLYNNLFNLLNKLSSDNPQFEEFTAQFEDDDQGELLDLVEKISVEAGVIGQKNENIELYLNFAPLKSDLDSLSIKFDLFPGFRKFEILAIISVLEKLTTELILDEDLDLEENLDTDIFSLLDVGTDVKRNNFLVYDVGNVDESLFLFNYTDINVFSEYIESITTGVQILYYLLGKFGQENAPLGNTKYILVRSDLIGKKAVVLATLHLHIIKTGEIIHNPYEYVSNPVLSTSSRVSIGLNYQQFNDSISIISEYNYQKDILDKYLRIYHVFENFMYKSPIVDIERLSAGQVFSIRDFQRMYESIQEAEFTMLKKLFEKILNRNESPGLTFKQKIHGAWQALIPTHFPDQALINLLLYTLKIKNGSGNQINFDMLLDAFPYFFTKLIYMFRNSMVHNRETEFHLTHSNLISHPVMGDTAKIVLEKFLLVALEEIAFSLIIETNDIVWYNGSILKLWVED